jgi:biopolymer transport protein ExbD
MSLQGRKKIEVQGGMSSMTDLVFLLLIFFIVLSLFANTQQMQVDLPSTKEAQKAATPNAQATVSIDKDTKYYVNRKPILAEQLEKELLNILPTGTNKMNVILVVDRTVATQETVYALSIIKKHQWTVALSTQQKN